MQNSGLRRLCQSGTVLALGTATSRERREGSRGRTFRPPAGAPIETPQGNKVSTVKSSATVASAIVLAAAFAGSAHAQTATQDVSYEVQAISQISFSGSPTLTISTATAGSAPTAA